MSCCDIISHCAYSQVCQPPIDLTALCFHSCFVLLKKTISVCQIHKDNAPKVKCSLKECVLYIFYILLHYIGFKNKISSTNWFKRFTVWPNVYTWLHLDDKSSNLNRWAVIWCWGQDFEAGHKCSYCGPENKQATRNTWTGKQIKLEN